MAFYFRNTKKDIIMTEEDEEDFKKGNFCRLRENKVSIDKVRDHCHLTGKYRRPAKNTCDIKVTQQQGIIIPFISHNFSNYDCHIFFKRLVDLKNDKLKLKIFPKADEGYISVRCGCVRLIDSYRFLWGSLDSLVETLVDNSHKTLNESEEKIVDNNEKINNFKGIEKIFKEDL